MAAHTSMVAAVRVDEDVDLVMGETVTGNYFRLLGVRPVLGRLLAPEDDRPGAARVAVISDRLWERAFGRDPGVLWPEPPHPVSAISRRGCRAARVRGHGACTGRGSVNSDDMGRRRGDGGHQVIRGLPGRDPARTPRRPLAVRQGEAPRGCHSGSGDREPRRDHGQSGRRLARLQRRSAGISDPDGRRAPAAPSGRRGGRPFVRLDTCGRDHSAGGARKRHGHAGWLARWRGGARSGCGSRSAPGGAVSSGSC